VDKQTILIVDDDKKLVQLLKETILNEENGYEVRTAYNGKEALDVIKKEKVDLVLLDISMPVMSGIQVLTELHNKKTWLPTIILTAYGEKEVDKKFQEFGIVDFINKPLDLKKLVKRIGEVLKNREHKDSISGMSLSAILQVLEMEQRTGVLTIKTKDSEGRIFFKDGRFVDIEAGDLSMEEALGEFIGNSSMNKEISIEYLNHRRSERINKSLTEILLEASRIHDEDENHKEEEVDMTTTKQSQTEDRIENQKFAGLIESLKEDLGDALLSTEIWTISEGEVVAGYQLQAEACDLFSQITVYLNEALSTAEYPELGNYYLLSLEGGKLKVIIPGGEYLWGMLIDSKKTPMGFLLKVVLSRMIGSFKETISS
jgi:two-component system OmpR family response regulator